MVNIFLWYNQEVIMGEYKIIQGDLSYCQKVLNQWKYEFNLTVISFISLPKAGEFAILTYRTKKEKL